METRLLERRKRVDQPLKPSLVEWKRVSGDTSGVGRRQPLKPSLVEWKLTLKDLHDVMRNTLKPSLVEWKHIYHPWIGIQSEFLETFLSGMETAERGRRLLSFAGP